MMSWTVVIPVKRLDTAKSRLGAADDPRRPELALAFARDVIDACRATSSVGAVIVVTDDEDVVAQTSGVTICPEPTPGSLNEAILEGATRTDGPLVAIAGDLPCLTPAALEFVLDLASANPRSLLSDAQGTGTAMLFAMSARELKPQFGVGSRSAHVQAGYVDLALESAGDIRALLAGARRDVDTPADLWDARRIGVGTHTAAILGSHA